MSDDVFELAAAERESRFRTHEIRDQPPEHVLAPKPKRLQPAIADVDDSAVTIDRVQHCRRSPIEPTIVLPEPRLQPELRVHSHRAQVVTLVGAVDDRRGKAVDALAAARHEVHGHTLQAPGTPQHRQIFLGDDLRDFLGREILRTHVRDLFAPVTEAFEPRVAGIDEESLLVQQHDQRRAPAEEPLVVGFDGHASSLRLFVVMSNGNPLFTGIRYPVLPITCCFS